MNSRVLFICTANQARSAVAEAVLRRCVPPDILVSSAGTQASDGRRCDPNTLAAARLMGLQMETHRSTRLTVDHLQTNDLIVCMTNEHLRHSVGMFTKAWERTFTLKELVRRASSAGPRSGGSFPDYLSYLHSGRSIKDAWIDDGPDDIADPIEQSPKGHHKILETVRELTNALGAFLQ